jgi:hypothetical protein
MHLMTFLQLKQPGPVFRATVIVAQWIFTLMFSTMYLVNPHYCHRQDIFFKHTFFGVGDIPKCQLCTKALLYFPLKPYTIAGFEPGSSVSGADAVFTTPRRQGHWHNIMFQPALLKWF